MSDGFIQRCEKDVRHCDTLAILYVNANPAIQKFWVYGRDLKLALVYGMRFCETDGVIGCDRIGHEFEKIGHLNEAVGLWAKGCASQTEKWSQALKDCEDAGRAFRDGKVAAKVNDARWVYDTGCSFGSIASCQWGLESRLGRALNTDENHYAIEVGYNNGLQKQAESNQVAEIQRTQPPFLLRLGPELVRHPFRISETPHGL
jgi:hypothetical protein